MKTVLHFWYVLLGFTLFSCDIIKGIFEVSLVTGILLVTSLALLIIFVMSRAVKKKDSADPS